jgi:hypothetical protein
MRRTITAAIVLTLFGCSSTQKPQPAAGPTAGGGPAPEPAAQPAADAPAADAPTDVEIANLVSDPEKVVRIKGVISKVVGMRLVPPQRILELTDNSGTVKVVIYDEAQFTEGTKMELVGQYKPIPSPTHDGPGEAPKEPIFVVERFLDMK